ncbi:hypothetical protein AHAS_Ahas13G0431900 [Arachis hypogaea]
MGRNTNSNKHDKDSRVWNKEAYQRLERDYFSIFIDNLPEDISKRELFHMFKWTEEAKYRRRAVIRNTTDKEVKVITRENARGNNSQPRSVKGTEEIRVRQPSCTPTKDPNNNGWTKKVEVPIVNENVSWLQRSIVGGTKQAIDFTALKQKVHNKWPGVTHVRELRAYKALITFESVFSVEEAYTFRINDLLKTFYMVWRWDETERSESRRVWLDCYGVLLHAWSSDTFLKIGEQWEEVVVCDKLTESCNSFSVGRVLIDTCVFDMINERIHVTIGASGFDVLVREVGGECDERPEVAWDQAAVLVTINNRMAEQEKDRLVNSCVNLNEWNHQNSNLYSGNGSYATLKEGEDSQGSSHINDEMDSEETISHNYYGCNGNQDCDGTRYGFGLAAAKPIMESKGNGVKRKNRAKPGRR